MRSLIGLSAGQRPERNLLRFACAASLTFGFAASADAASVRVIAEKGEGKLVGGSEVAAGQLKCWTVAEGNSLDIDVSFAATADARTPADFVLVFRERKIEEAAKAEVRVSASDAGKAIAARIVAALSAKPAEVPDPAVPKISDDAAATNAVLSAPPVTLVDLGEADRALAGSAGKVPVVIIECPAIDRMPVSQRARFFRIAAHEVVAGELKAFAGSVDRVLPDREAGALHIGIYDGLGSNRSPGPEAMYGIAGTIPNAKFTFVGPNELQTVESTKQFDVLMFPGGTGGGQARALGPNGREAVKSFVRDGGAYIGNCAGGYLASSGYKWSLGLLNVKTVDSKNWARGTGDVQVELTDDGRKLLGEHGTVTIRYANGPIYASAGVADLPEVSILAYYRTEFARNGATPGAMINTPAIVAAPYGKGRVVAFSCHPEYSKDYKDFIVRAIDWTTKPTSASQSSAPK
jgi:glutamine amidotransferase-like uncharacterized protein